MSLDNVIFPEPFKLANRDQDAVSKFQLALFQSAEKALRRTQPVVVQAGSVLMRSVEDKYGKTGYEARKIPPAASNSAKVRWSGHVPNLNLKRGALYTSLDTKGLLNENIRYKRPQIDGEVPWTRGGVTTKAKYQLFGEAPKDFRKLLVDRAYYTFELKRDLKLYDLTPSDANSFYAAVEQHPDCRKAKEALGLRQELWALAFDPLDYTVSRPLGLAALLSGVVDGIQVMSAQTEVPELPGLGLNVVIAGADGKDLTFLEPIGAMVAGKHDGHSALVEIGVDGNPARLNALIVPGETLRFQE